MKRLTGNFAVWVFACAAIGCAKKDAATATSADVPAVAVTVAPIQARAIRRSVDAVGTLNGFEEVTLAPKVEGRVLSIRADVGDIAVPGSVLLELDTTDYVLSVAEAKQAFAAELAKLDMTELPVGEPDLSRIPIVKRAAVSLEDAERRFQVKKNLLANKAVSKDEYDVAETDVRLAEATRTQAVTEAKATLAAARLRKATLELAEQRLRDCKLTVPVPAGWEAWASVVGPGFAPLRFAVAQRMLAEGEMVRSMPVTNAFKLVIDFKLKLRVTVPERYTAELKNDQIVAVSVEAYPDRTFPGRVARINPTIDSLNRTFQVEIEVPNATNTLKAGGFAKADITTKLEANRIVVPPAAIVAFAGVNTIYLVDGERAKSVRVTIGTREKDWVEVQGDIPTGSRVILSGQSQLADGSPIRIRN